MTSSAYRGPKGQSILHEFWPWPMTAADTEAIEAQLAAILDHVKGAEPDRLLALVAGLVVENAVDSVLRAFLPGFKALNDRAFTFSMRIRVLEALALVPAHMPRNADFVRDVRNDFAHDLTLQTLSALPPGDLQSLADRHKALALTSPATTPAAQLRALAFHTAAGLLAYSKPAGHLRTFLHTPAFERALVSHVEPLYDV